MAKNISTGVDKIVEQLNKKQDELQQLQWRDLRNKIDSILLSTNILKTDEARRACIEIDNMTPEAREQFITQRWGPAYLNKVSHLLYQLATLEARLSNEKIEPEYEMKQIGKTEKPLNNFHYATNLMSGVKATIVGNTVSAKLIHRPVAGTVVVSIFESESNQIPFIQVIFEDHEIDVRQSINTLTVIKNGTKVDYDKKSVSVALSDSLVKGAVAKIDYEYNDVEMDELQEDDINA